jgi:hypothetical protein
VAARQFPVGRTDPQKPGDDAEAREPRVDALWLDCSRLGFRPSPTLLSDARFEVFRRKGHRESLIIDAQVETLNGDVRAEAKRWSYAEVEGIYGSR